MTHATKSSGRGWKRPVIVASSILGGLVVIAAAAVVIELPHASLTSSTSALAAVHLSGVPQKIESVDATINNKVIATTLANHNAIVPTSKVPVSVPVDITVTLRRPSWIAWLLGSTETLHETVTTPTAKLLDPVAIETANHPVTSDFSQPVSVVRITGDHTSTVLHLSTPSERVALAKAIGQSSAGIVKVSAAPEPWEQLTAPTSLTYFQESGNAPIAVISPGTTNLTPSSPLTITLSEPVAHLFGSSMPTIRPTIAGADAVTGSWTQTTEYTLTFTPSGPNFWPGEQFTLSLPSPVSVSTTSGSLAPASKSITLSGAALSDERLQQMLAGLNYLPLSFTPTTPATSSTLASVAASTTAPVPGSFSWRWSVPTNLSDLWQVGNYNVITQGATMAFEQDNHLNTDGLANPLLWPTLVKDTVSGTVDPHPYSYILVHENLPENLTLYENGQVALTSLANTGIPGRTTAIGTFPIYERFTVAYMNGINPNGTPYHDLVHWINYFHGGDAVHGFVRATYGHPQSLGCVELPVPVAAQVFPLVHIGTLVTVVPVTAG